MSLTYGPVGDSASIEEYLKKVRSATEAKQVDERGGCMPKNLTDEEKTWIERDQQGVRPMHAQRPVFADMCPSVEHVDELERRLKKCADEEEHHIKELQKLRQVSLRVADKCEKLMKRYGVDV